MKGFKYLLAVAVLLSFSLSSSLQAQQPAQLKTPSDDQLTIFRALRNLPCKTNGGMGCHNLNFRGRTVDFDVTTQKKNTPPETTHYSINLTALPKITYECAQKRHWSGIVTYKLTDCEYRAGGLAPAPEVSALLSSFRTNDGSFNAACMNRLHEYSLQPEHTILHFHHSAQEWRALPQRPPIADAVRVQRLMAEDAVKQNQPYMALYYYERGLEIDPLWPEGHFNAALVCASIKMYAMAAEYMEFYLELMPNAPDAQNASDQIAMWKLKAQEH